APARVRRRLQPRARHQRRAEDDGHHRRPPLHLGLPEDVLRAVLGHPDLPRGHRARHHVRRLAHRAHHGHAPHGAAAARRLLRQIVSAAGYSLGHGTNDAQKTMGIIAVLLFTSGYLKTFYVPFWVILICHAAIALGTMFGGWRIVRTMGMRLTALQPLGGFCAETAGAIALLGSAAFGIPVSTTHTITGAIVGVGSTRRFSAVRW